MIKYFCCDERRRDAVKKDGRLNGIDFLEVLDDPTFPDERQRTLFVHFICDPDVLQLSKENVRIEGGERIRDVMVTDARIGVDPRSGTTAKVLIVEVDQPGDFSTYTLHLVPDAADPQRLDQFDPILRVVDFSFKVNCESDFDCRQERVCPPEPRTEPVIDYLAKDYASFRQLMLDRLAVLVPQWKERNPADLGIALIELLAYIGDYLSYQQDAVATEAYLYTARRRVSVRRHAWLVDYFMHDGCNARAWVQVQVESGPVELKQGTQLLTAVVEQPIRIQPNSTDYYRALGSGAEVFETMHGATLFPAHDELHFYTWGARECCLPKGATCATLRGKFPDLKPGAVLIFKEVRSPRTGDPDDADLTHRHAVRLVEVSLANDPIGGRFDLPSTDNPVDVTEIRWATDDALPFPLCISAETDAQYGGAYVDNVSVALGNIVLADHGLPLEDEPLGSVPASTLVRVPAQGWANSRVRQAGAQGARDDEADDDDHCRQRRVEPVPPRFRPVLKERPVTQAAPYDPTNPPPSARAAIQWSAREALPAITLRSQLNGASTLWKPQRDLLNSGPDQTEFVVEVEADGRAYLRFGDGRYGARPPVGAVFTVTYRLGNGVRGNVGADALRHIVSSDPAIVKVTNPLPAWGGVEPESIEQVRQNAPSAFRTQARAVTPQDYAAVSNRHGEVQQAAASLRWTGSWHTVFVSVDRLGGAKVDDVFEADLRDHLEPYRMAGHDLEIDRPHMVPLEIAMRVEVQPDYFRSDVKAAVLRLFSNRILPDGRRGVFHPDNFTFGQTVYLSPLYAAAQAVEGVASVHIVTFQRRDAPGLDALEQGKLILGRLEIARLDNDPNFPDRGVFRLIMEGGK